MYAVWSPLVSCGIPWLLLVVFDQYLSSLLSNGLPWSPMVSLGLHGHYQSLFVSVGHPWALVAETNEEQ